MPLTLPADSVFARLTGTAAAIVHQQPLSQWRALSAAASGNSVVVHRSLFLDNGIFRFVADHLFGW